MADEFKSMRMAKVGPAVHSARLDPSLMRATMPGVKIRPEVIAPSPPPPAGPAPPPPSPPVVTPQPAPPPVVPPAPSANPFDSLPMPSPGDRIKADDFKKLSQALLLIRDAWQLSGSLLGREFGEAKQALTSQQYTIVSVLSVFGHQIADVSDPSLDHRKVIQVIPLELGEKNVAVVVTEAVESRRTVPRLHDVSYTEALERLENIMGDITVPSESRRTPRLVDLSLEQAKAVTR